jgi:hypothetical protein
MTRNAGECFVRPRHHVAPIEHVAGVDDVEVAVATYRAVILRWPRAQITLRQGARVVMKTWTE